ncbi:MAG: TRAP transporter large permease [Firmicutes bacterium]|jgi:tripartite ATP-independent transporter DctM subunit|nr:TRAP transporter large permease [Bacillota bacterium]
MAYAVIAGFVVLFVLGLPAVLAITIPSIIYFLVNDLPITMIAQRFHYALNSFPLVAVPVFIFAGNLMNTSGHTNRIFKFADDLVGRMHGGLAQVNIFASLIFSGISGAALADVGGLGAIEIKAMEEKGFSKAFAAAVTVASATVGPIFPPSIPLVIYGAVTGTSVIKLLLAGILPAIFTVIVLMIVTAILSILRGYPRAESWPKLSVVRESFLQALPSLLAPAFLVFGMLSGYFTPTEAASIVVVYIILVSVFVYKDFSLHHVISSVFDAIKSTAAIMIIIASAALLQWILAVDKVPTACQELLAGFTDNKVVLLLVVNLLLFVVGMILDSTTATILVIPMIVPALHRAGVDPVHLGVVIIFNLMVGLLTPPMGLSLYLVSDIAKVPMVDVLRELRPYFVALVLVLGIITYVPWISTVIPSFVG